MMRIFDMVCILYHTRAASGREREVKCRPRALAALELYLPSMHGDDVLGDVEPESRAVRVFLLCIRGAEEAGEDAGLFVLGNADAVIRNRKSHPIPDLRRHNRDLAAGQAVLDRVL